MKLKTLKNLSIFWTLFIGLGAVGGSVCMFIDPSGQSTGMAGLLPGLGKMPFAEVLFQNLIFSGISLLIVNGLSQLFSFYLLVKRNKKASSAVIACGAVLVLWICIQFVIFPLNVLSTAYFIFGLLEALTGLLMKRKETAA